MPHPTQGYRLKDGTRVPGVTTIIGRFKDSGALLYWAFAQGRLAEQGLISKLYDKRDAAADAGTIAHAMVEAYIHDEPMDKIMALCPKTNIGDQAHQGFQNYLTWERNNRIQVIAQEMEMVSEQYRFGGCPDAIGIDSQGRRCLLDWKTSSSGPFVDFLLQLAAYNVLWEENNPNKPIDGGFHLCRFSKDSADFHHHYWSELQVAKEQFLLFRQAYDLDKVLKKRL